MIFMCFFLRLSSQIPMIHKTTKQVDYVKWIIHFLALHILFDNFVSGIDLLPNR